MSKHTPGPWMQPTRYDAEAQCEIPCGAIEAAGSGIIVASVRDMTMREAAGNARLICAAPDLLDALRSVLCYRAELPAGIVLRAEAVIAKAEGRG